MEKQTFQISIQASPEKVWNVIVGTDSYPIWTAPFAEGSSVETDWKKGSKALFLDGKGSGMVAVIEESIPYEYLSIKHLGEVVGGVEDTTSDRVKEWAGAHENYMLKELDGRTHWTVELDITAEYADYMAEKWPLAMEKVKELAEG